GSTPAFRPEEVARGAEAVPRFFDAPAYAARQQAAASIARQRLLAEELAPQYARFLGDLAARHAASGTVPAEPPPGRSQSVVLVPHLNGIEWECEQALRRLEAAGVRGGRRGGGPGHRPGRHGAGPAPPPR